MKEDLSDKPFDYGDHIRLLENKVVDMPDGGVVCEIQESDLGGSLELVSESDHSDVFHTDNFDYAQASPSPATVLIWLEDGDAELVDD